ncbi:DUF4402 domain-containing protein [Novosphingobium sp.]|uniref:DUF4402 domain-containing protein n=1 Tax=Novosphingobium sp. TaxID=1874826 RepID=UPI003B515897
MPKSRLYFRNFARGLLTRLAPTLFVIMPCQAHAAAATFTATANQPLSFGTLVVSGSGSRTIAPDGTSTSTGILPLGDSISGPAQFTMTYTHASGLFLFYFLQIQVTMPSANSVTINGVQGTISNFTTDLPGMASLQPGQTGTATVTNCFSPTCTIVFHVGGTLNVTSGNQGAQLVFPLQLVATVTQVLG